MIWIYVNVPVRIQIYTLYQALMYITEVYNW